MLFWLRLPVLAADVRNDGSAGIADQVADTCRVLQLRTRYEKGSGKEFVDTNSLNSIAGTVI